MGIYDREVPTGGRGKANGGLDGICETELFGEKLEEQCIQFADGDIFVLISDGLSEAQDQNRAPYGEEPIADLITAYNHLSAEKIKDGIMSEIQRFAGSMPQHDDQTLVVVKVKPG